MSTTEIRSRMATIRGVNHTFQIYAADPLVRIGPGTWGLLHRDVDLGAAQSLAATLRLVLQERQVGLHMTELPNAVGLQATDGSGVSASLLSMAESVGIRVDPGQYAYLADWRTSRRIALPEAARTAVAEAGALGIMFADVCRRVNELTRREVPTHHVSSALRDLEVAFNVVTKLWTPAVDRSYSTPGSVNITSTGSEEKLI